MAQFTSVSDGYTKRFQLPEFTKINWVTVNGLTVDHSSAGNYVGVSNVGSTGQSIVIDYQAEGTPSATVEGAATPQDDNVFTGVNTFKRTKSEWVDEVFNTAQVISAASPYAEVIMTDDMVLSNVLIGATGDGETLYREFKQDATGGHLVSFDEAVFAIGEAGWPTVPTTANSYSAFTLTRSKSGKWLVAVVALGVL